MNSGATFERVYDALKRRLLSGEFPPGARLDPGAIAETAAASVTPIRDALNMLTGEGLVETRLGEGFYVPQVNEPGLADLYDWNAQLVVLAIRRRNGDRHAIAAPSPESIADFAADTSMLFDAIGALSSNIEHCRAMRTANDRLHGARRIEASLFPDGAAELSALAAALSVGNMAELRALSAIYHRRRRMAVGAIVRALYRAA